MEGYSYNQHRHNFSVWTAARAAQRGFASTKAIKLAIDHSDLRAFAESESDCSYEEFEEFHRNCCKQIIAALKVEPPHQTSYGRAAKIVAIYLKTSVVISSKGLGNKSKNIHPPIDNILLSALSVKVGILLLKKDRWTQLTEKKYWDLVSSIKLLGIPFDWTLEEFWKPEINNKNKS